MLESDTVISVFIIVPGCKGGRWNRGQGPDGRGWTWGCTLCFQGLLGFVSLWRLLTDSWCTRLGFVSSLDNANSGRPIPGSRSRSPAWLLGKLRCFVFSDMLGSFRRPPAESFGLLVSHAYLTMAREWGMEELLMRQVAGWWEHSGLAPMGSVRLEPRRQRPPWFELLPVNYDGGPLQAVSSGICAAEGLVNRSGGEGGSVLTQY